VQLIEGHFDYVYWTLRRLGAGSADAEDIAQEVFLVMWRRRSVFDPARPLRPWIAGIAARAVQEHRRRGRREVADGLIDVPDETRSPEEHLASAQARRLVLEAMADVPLKQRIVLMMHDLDEVPMRQISLALAVPLFTLYSRLTRGRRAFARAIRRVEATPLLRRSGTPAALLAASQGERPAPSGARKRGLARLRSWLSSGAPVPLEGTALERPVRGAPRRGPGLGWGLVVFAVGIALLGVLLASSSRSSGRGPEQPAATSSGPVGLWRFDEAGGSTIARDGSGAGSDCVLHKLDPQVAWRPGVRGQSLALTGRGWLSCPATSALGAIDRELTIAAWVTDGEVLANYHALVSRQLGSGRQDAFMFGFANGELLFVSHVWAGRVTRPLPRGRGPWFHVAVTRRADGLAILYVDGREIGRESTRPASLPKDDNPLIIGAAINDPDPQHTQARFDGAVDELSIFARALSATEVAALANPGSRPLLDPKLAHE
jgi:RNA polymerase sigma-70 factor (ECF subfamily)